MPEILICPVCGKEYKSKYFFDNHVEAHGEHEVTWDEDKPVIEEIEEVVMPEVEAIEVELDPGPTPEATPHEE